MTLADDERFIRMAIQLSQQAVAHGNQPFGAVLVRDGKVLLARESTKITTRDCSRHSETSVAAAASGFLTREELAECTLYSSTEPCAMCSGAIYWSGIGRVVFACSNDALGKLAGNNLNISCREIFARGKRHVEVAGPLLEEEALPIHEQFWKAPVW
jgi:tRNA(Arg) A34 adenosine deaminase TadA